MTKSSLYLQITNFIREKISRGEWHLGSKIPTQRELAQQFNVNRSTVITAIETLKAEGLLEGKAGSGVYIVNNTWTVLSSILPPNWNTLSQWSIHPPSDNIVQTINQVESKNEFIQLSKGELGTDLFPQSEISKTVEKVSNQLHQFGYGDGFGDEGLRKEISLHIKQYGIKASPSSILVVSGALQALQLISLGILKRNSTVFIENPSYLYSINAFRSAGMTLRGISINENGLSLDELFKQKIIKKLSALYINPTYHNPTSILMPLEKREELMRKSRYFELPIIEDDIYRDLWIDKPAPAPLKALDNNGQVLYVGSFSKTIAAGLRIGWILGPEGVIKRLSDLKMQVDYGSSYISQVLVRELLASGLYEKHINKVRVGLKNKRNFLLDLLSHHLKGYAKWSKPEGGFFIWVTFNSNVNVKKLFKRALDSGVLINPGFIYNYDMEPAIRLSYAYPNFEEMEKGILILKQLVTNDTL